MSVACVRAESILKDSPYNLDVIEVLDQIEVIFGRDVTTNDVFLIYGRKRLLELSTDLDSTLVDVLMIDLDRHSDELNQVLAMVQLAKRCCEYAEM